MTQFGTLIQLYSRMVPEWYFSFSKVLKFVYVGGDIRFQQVSTLHLAKVSEKPNIYITSNDRPFGCPIITSTQIHNAILLIDTSTVLDTMRLIR